MKLCSMLASGMLFFVSYTASAQEPPPGDGSFFSPYLIGFTTQEALRVKIPQGISKDYSFYGVIQHGFTSWSDAHVVSVYAGALHESPTLEASFRGGFGGFGGGKNPSSSTGSTTLMSKWNALGYYDAEKEITAGGTSPVQGIFTGNLIWRPVKRFQVGLQGSLYTDSWMPVTQVDASFRAVDLDWFKVNFGAKGEAYRFTPTFGPEIKTQFLVGECSTEKISVRLAPSVSFRMMSVEGFWFGWPQLGLDINVGPRQCESISSTDGF